MSAAAPATSPPRIFISYSHKLRGSEWKRRLLEHLKPFSDANLIQAWDDEQIPGGWRWEKEIEKAIHDARLAVILLTKEALESEFILERELAPLSQREKDGLIVIPILCEPCAWNEHPWLKQVQIRPFEAKPLSTITDPAELSRVLRRLATEIAEELGRTALAKIPPASTVPGAVREYLEKFPLTRGPGLREEKLIGREQELALLDLAFASSFSPSPLGGERVGVRGESSTAIVSLVAWGGVGKTMLVQHWLQRLQHEGWFGVRRVYAWSFYSQGTKEDRQASEDTFLAHALEWFGVQCEPTLHPSEKGRLLADAIARERTLLILDGIEPLQYPPGPMGGQLRAPGVQSLLKQLARKASSEVRSQKPEVSNCLCLVTTREPLTDLADFQRREGSPWGSVLRVDLGNLTDEAGAALLHHAGANRAGAAEIKPDDKELLAASREVDGHALTLNLLGRFLARAHGGDIRRRDLVKFEEADRKEQGGTTFKMLAAFENWLRKSRIIGPPLLAVMRTLGLFGRPADSQCISALLDAPVIDGLTGPLFMPMTAANTYTRLEPPVEDDWNVLVSFLSDFGLLATQESPDDQNRLLDCHPLIREHFAKRIREEYPEAWRSGHHRLFAHLSATAMEYPGTIREMEPLYQAVHHGCNAGRHQEALDEIYHRRIQRGETAFNIDTLGAIGADLAMLAAFFEEPWTTPVKALTEPDRTFVTGQAAFRLTFLGRLQEALVPNQLFVEQRVEQAERQRNERAWNNACYAAGNLASVHFLLGDLPNALKYAEQSVVLGERGAAHWQRSMAFAGRAEVHHFAGRNPEASADFIRAEAAAKKHGLPFLSSVQGLRYSSFLIDQRQYDQAIERARAIIFEGQAMRWAVDVGWGYLILAQAKMRTARGIGEGSHKVIEDCDAAMRWLTAAGIQDRIIRCLLTRAESRRLANNDAQALADLAEARERAARCGMRLLIADCNLAYCRNHLANAQFETADKYLCEAEAIIKEAGYHRRDGEVRELRVALVNHLINTGTTKEASDEQ